MADDAGIQSILKQFASKAGTSEIEYAAFVMYAQKYARHQADRNEVMKKLSENPESVINPCLVQLQRERVCLLVTDEGKIKMIVLSDHFTRLVRNEMKKIEESQDAPFPEEDTLKMELPSDWVCSLSVENDLGPFLLKSTDFAYPFYRITFSESLRPIILTPEMLGEKLLELSILKIRNWLRKGSNKEFVNRKMMSAFVNKEMMLKDAFKMVMTRPYDAIQEVVRSTSDFTFPFWAYLLSNVRQDLLKKTDKTYEDLSLFQSVILTEFFNNFYRGKAQRVLDVETAFRNFDLAVRKPPYWFTMDDLCRFTDTKGSPLLGKYNREEFEKYLHEKTRSLNQAILPEIIVIPGPSGKKLFMSKDRVIPLSVKMLAEARQAIRTQLIQGWFKLMGEFLSYPSMEDDNAFRQELWSRLDKSVPILATILRENVFTLLFIEIRGQNAIPEIERCFKRSELVPIDELLQLKRKDILTDVRILLPFWYTVPVFSSIFAFFQKMFKKRAPEKDLEIVGDDSISRVSPKDKRAELAVAAANVEKSLVPPGMTLDGYLEELEIRWNKLINPESKRDLTEDVNSLIRDYLRGVIRTLRAEAFTPERVRSLAATLADAPAMLKIKNHKAIEEYITIYLIRLVKTYR